MESLPFRSTFHKYRKIVRAVVSRLILGGHAAFGAYWIASRLDNLYYILLAATVALFVIETATIVYFRAGCEWKRFCTPFAVYLMCLVPVLWGLKFHAAEQARDAGNHTDTGSDVKNDSEPFDPTNIGAIVGKGDGLGKLLAEESVPSLLEQSMMIVLILCRWLLPRGRIDRSSLSQLLIMYSAISADVLDFSEIFDTASSAESSDTSFQYIVLGVWSWSLVQFTLVVTTSFQFRLRKNAKSGKRLQQSANEAPDDGGQDKSEALSILMVFFMQDGPFLLARVYAIFVLKLKDYQIMFFSLKNALTLILGLYRLMVLCGCVSREGNDLLTDEEVAKSMESLDTIIVDSKSPKVKRAKKGKK